MSLFLEMTLSEEHLRAMAVIMPCLCGPVDLVLLMVVDVADVD
jgi:hypothetical protein